MAIVIAPAKIKNGPIQPLTTNNKSFHQAIIAQIPNPTKTTPKAILRTILPASPADFFSSVVEFVQSVLPLQPFSTSSFSNK